MLVAPGSEPAQEIMGTDAHSVGWSPSNWTLYPGLIASWNIRPPDVGLFHELVHAYQDLTQEFSAEEDWNDEEIIYQSPDGNLRMEVSPWGEHVTVGASAFDYRVELFTENRYREQRGLQLRYQYSDQPTLGQYLMGQQ